MSIYSIEPSLDPLQCVLLLPLALFQDMPVSLGATAGLPADTLDIAAANLMITATPCDAPLFTAKVEATCACRSHDILLIRNGLFPETLNLVTVDVALTGPDGPLLLGGLCFLRHRDGSLWLVPRRSTSPARWGGPYIAIRGTGLAPHIEPPFATWSERSNGICRAAAEIVRLVADRRGR